MSVGVVSPVFIGRQHESLPAALAHGITTEANSAAMLAELAKDALRFADRPVLWPLMIGAWKRKGLAERSVPPPAYRHQISGSMLHIADEPGTLGVHT